MKKNNEIGGICDFEFFMRHIQACAIRAMPRIWEEKIKYQYQNNEQLITKRKKTKQIKEKKVLIDGIKFI